MDSWCWLWSRCPLWKTYSETHYRLCEWRTRNEVNLMADGCFFLAISHPHPQRSGHMKPAAALHHLTSHPCGGTKRTRYTPRPRARPSSAQAPPPLPYTASWVDDCLLKPHPPKHTHTRTSIVQIVIYYGFNLLLWMNQGLRLALCSVQYSLVEGTKKMCRLSHVSEREQIISLFFSMNFF